MLPHQERVVVEKTELDVKIKALIGFFDTKIFQALPANEQQLLSDQFKHMVAYSDVLELRIKGFTE